MKKINEDFNVPYYIFEELVEYIELSHHGYAKPMKWENIKALVMLAVVNERLSKEQATFLIERYGRENTSSTLS